MRCLALSLRQLCGRAVPRFPCRPRIKPARSAPSALVPRRFYTAHRSLSVPAITAPCQRSPPALHPHAAAAADLMASRSLPRRPRSPPPPRAAGRAGCTAPAAAPCGWRRRPWAWWCAWPSPRRAPCRAQRGTRGSGGGGVRRGGDAVQGQRAAVRRVVSEARQGQASKSSRGRSRRPIGGAAPDPCAPRIRRGCCWRRCCSRLQEPLLSTRRCC